MRITSKFNGACKECSGRLPAGSVIEWSPADGARHADNATCLVAKAAPPAPALTLNLGSVVAFLLTAKTNGLKFPAIRFLAPDAKSELRLSVAGSTSKFPGAVQVKIGWEWIGRVTADGAVAGPLVDRPDVIAEMNAIAADPAGKAAAYGALMGRCSFCNLTLTDDGSVEVGYGPICAKHYGLPHKPRGARAVTIAS